MGFYKSFLVALTASRDKLNEYIFMCSNRIKPEYFSRTGKMSFKESMLFMLNLVKKTMQVELNDFFESVIQKTYTVSKQAYSEGRQRIDPKAFIELNDRINEVIYKECNEFKLWNGYRVSAIDGSILEIPDTEMLRNEFGYIENQNYKIARAKASCIYDVINKIVIKSKIDKYNTSERDMAKTLLLQMNETRLEHELVLFDRGYPSADFIAFLITSNIDFVIRTPKSFSTVVKNARKADQIIEIIYEGKCYKVRVVRLMLDSGVEEILLTSLFDSSLTIKDFKELYFRRWGIEIKFDELKNRIEIENFTGKTQIAIEQDFYASIYLSNMAELARQHSDGVVEAKNDGKELKHEYKTNINVLIGSLKDKLVLMMLEERPKKRNKLFKKIIDTISRNCVPIRHDRANPRITKKSSRKYRTGQKRCL
jgi:hypothetical protein